MATVLEIVITGDEKGYTAAVKNAQGATIALGQEQQKAGQAGSGAFQRMEQGSRKSTTALLPLKSALIDLTGATGSVGTAVFNLIRFGFTPMGIAIGVTIAVATTLISKWISGAREAEELSKALQQQSNQLATLNVEYRAMVGSVSAADAAVQKFRINQNQQLEDLADRIEKIKSINKALIPGLGSATQFILGAFGLSADDQRRAEAELSARQGLVDAQARGIKRNTLTGEAEKSADAERALRNEIEATQIELIKLTQGEEAAARATLEHEEATALEIIADQKLSPIVAVLIRQRKEEKMAVLEAKEALESFQQRQKFLTESETAENAVREQTRREIDAEFDLKEKLAALDVERLKAMGLENEATRLQLENLIKLNDERNRALQNADINRVPGEIEIRTRETENARIQIERLGEVTINVGNEITRATTNIFSAAINGTLKLSDIGKSALLTVGRTVTEFFSQVLSKKLGFEQIIFSNLRGFLPAANQALAAGGVAIPGAAGGGGGGGFLSNISGIAGPLLSAGGGGLIGGLIGGGPGGLAGSIISGIGSLATSFIASSIGGILASGAAIAGTGGAAAASSAALAGGLGASIGGALSIGIPVIGGLIGGLFGLFGGKSKKQKKAESVARRLKAANAALQSVQGAGFQLTQQEADRLSQFARTGFIAEGVSIDPAVGLESLSIPFLTAVLEELRAKGGRALSAVPSLQAHFASRGLPTGSPSEIFPVFQKQEEEKEQTARQQQIADQTSRAIEEQTKQLQLELDILGKSAAEAFTLRREFELSKLAAEGMTDEQLKSLRVLAEQRDELQRQFALQQGFEILRQSFQREVEEARFGIMTFGLAPEEAAHAKREFELTRLGREGLDQPQIQILRQLMRERDDLRSALEGLRNPAPTSVSITINGDVSGEEDVRELARRISELLSGGIAP